MNALIIAECGINHNGHEDIAYQLIDAAVRAGADVAKFQLYNPELLAEPGEKRAMLQRLLLPRDAYLRLAAYCQAYRIGFACTAFDADNLGWLLKNTNMAFVKISSGEGDNSALLDCAGASGLPVIQSIRPGDAYVSRRGWKYLHVVSEYPTPPENSRLPRVTRYAGLSDHSGDIYAPLAAVTLGAKIIECHITLDKEQEGPDHKASLDPVQFKQLVHGIRVIEKAMT